MVFLAHMIHGFFNGNRYVEKRFVSPQHCVMAAHKPSFLCHMTHAIFRIQYTAANYGSNREGQPCSNQKPPIY